MIGVTNEKKLREDLAETRGMLRLYPDHPRHLEEEARVLRWLGEPAAAESFIKAARLFEQRGSYNPRHVGNLYRLAARREEATLHLEGAYDRLHLLVGSSPNPSVDKASAISGLAQACLLLGRNEEAVALTERLAETNGNVWRYPGLLAGRLASSRLGREASLATEAIEDLVDTIRKDRYITPAETGALTFFDLLEIALRLESELEGRGPGPRPPFVLLRDRKSGERRRQPSPHRRLTREQVGLIFEEQDEEPDLYRADLSGMAFRRVDFSGANLGEADLGGADLTETLLEEVNLTGAILTEAKLTGAEMPDVLLEGADLQGADLSEANLERARLAWANLRRADLSGADLSDSDLTGADLSGADLRGTNLQGTDLEGTIMDGVLE